MAIRPDRAAQNNLSAQFAKDYGWDPVPLPEASRGGRGASAPPSAPHPLETPESN